LKNINGAALFAWLISHQPTVLFSHNKPASSNQPAVVFSQNKPAPTISHQPTEQVVQNKQKASDITTDLSHVAWLAFN
jgi:beta-lactamase class A